MVVLTGSPGLNPVVRLVLRLVTARRRMISNADSVSRSAVSLVGHVAHSGVDRPPA